MGHAILAAFGGGMLERFVPDPVQGGVISINVGGQEVYPIAAVGDTFNTRLPALTACLTASGRVHTEHPDWLRARVCRWDRLLHLFDYELKFVCRLRYTGRKRRFHLPRAQFHRPAEFRQRTGQTPYAGGAGFDDR